MISGLPPLSLVIWVPIVAGIVVATTGSDRHARTARWLALIGAVLGLLVALPLYTQFDPAAHGFQFQEMGSLDPRASTSTITWASTASRCS